MADYDVIIVGGGISGTSLLFTLRNYTNVGRVALIEKESELGAVNSHRNNNSQTLHFGDIETNYTLEKARKVKFAADMLKNYVLKYDPKKKLYSKYHKMVLAVGEEQVQQLKERTKTFKILFENITWKNRKEIAKLEPRVVEGRNEDEEIGALYSPDGYTMDFGAISQSFVEHTKNTDIQLKTKVIDIQRKEKHFKIQTEKETLKARVVIFATGAHSLLYAKKMGYGCDLSLFCIAGSFYFVPRSLNGKVYTMQKEKLPFAAIHGDPDVHEEENTRFGPTAKAVFLLERHRYKTIKEYIRSTGFGLRILQSFIKINSDPTILGYILKNLLYDVPIIGRRLFLKEVRKVVPLTKLSELEYAKGYGGIRPQIVNLKTKTLDMGEAKIVEDKIIFNITPSPGATTCLRNAYDDSERIVKFLGKKYTFNKKKFERDFVCGQKCWDEDEEKKKGLKKSKGERGEKKGKSERGEKSGEEEKKETGAVSEDTVLSFG